MDASLRMHIAERCQLTEADRDRIGRLRHDHTRLGLAYQFAFIRLTGRLPRHAPFEVARDLLHYFESDPASGSAQAEDLQELNRIIGEQKHLKK